MGDTKIEWTDKSWNPIRARNRETGGTGHFCIHASPGCANCYSETMQPRFENPIAFRNQDERAVSIFLDTERLHEPLGWRKPRMVFVCSMTDLFLHLHSDQWLIDIWANMAIARRHTFQVLTKRIRGARVLLRDSDFVEKVREIFELVMAGEPDPLEWQWPLPNVWVLTSVEDQRRANERIPELVKTPAAVRGLSVEPLLEAVTLAEWAGRLDWVIVGGESGHRARPMYPDWARQIRDECEAAGVPFFFKQWGEWSPTPMDHFPLVPKKLARVRPRERPVLTERLSALVDSDQSCLMGAVGKKVAGRLLDDREHNGMPNVR